MSGIYVEFCGNMKIPEAKLPGLTQRMSRLLEQGGIMDVEEACLYEKKILLLRPSQIDKDKRIVFTYSYFDNCVYRTAAYNTETGRLCHSQYEGLGFGHFYDVVVAAYVLLEFYTEGYGVTTVEDHFAPGVWRKIEWLNYLFDEAFEDTRLRDPWKLYEIIQRDKHHIFEKQDPLSYLSSAPVEASQALAGVVRYLAVAYTEIVRKAAADIGAFDELDTVEAAGRSFLGRYVVVVSGQEIGDYLKNDAPEMLRIAADYAIRSGWLKKCSPSMKDDHIPFCALVDLCASSLETLLNAHPVDREDLFDRLCLILKDHASFCPAPEDPYMPFWFSSYLLPKEVILKLVSDAFEMDFWKLLDKLGASVDEKSEDWCSKATKNWGGSSKPQGKRSTTDFLNGKYTPLTDDDRAYFWKPDGDVNFSDEMNAWLEKLGKELDEIEAGEEDPLRGVDFTKALIEAIYEADQAFKRLHFFRDAFYEFIEKRNERRVRAAVELIRRMTKRNREELEQWIESEHTTYFDAYHPARQEVKRYFAVLGNPHLREKWLKL